jgi:hypothetical protein
VSEAPRTAAAEARDFVAEPPGQRTRLIVVSDDDYEAIGRLPAPVLKTIGAATGGAAAVGAGAAWWSAAASTGALVGTPVGWAAVAGMGISYPAYRRWLRPHMPLFRSQRSLDARLVRASVAARLRMPQGPPQTNTLYVVHPRRTREYLPAGPFHLRLAEEKVAEAMGLMRALGAARIEVRAEFSDQSKTAAHVVLDAAARAVDATGERTRTESGRVESTYECDGSDTPHVPDNLVWLEVEPTWRELVAGRLSTTNRIRSFTVLIHLDQAYGFSSDLAGKALKQKIGLGGEVSGAMQRVWRMTAAFPG